MIVHKCIIKGRENRHNSGRYTAEGEIFAAITVEQMILFTSKEQELRADKHTAAPE